MDKDASLLRCGPDLMVCMHTGAAVCAGMQGLLCRCWLGGWPAQLGPSQGARSRRGRGAGCSQQVPETASHLLSPTLSARSRPANHWHTAGQLRKCLQRGVLQARMPRVRSVCCSRSLLWHAGRMRAGVSAVQLLHQAQLLQDALSLLNRTSD